MRRERTIMEKSSFGALLEHMFVLAGIKNTILAQELNYDASYISKWMSGKTLPSKKNIEIVIETISMVLTEHTEEDRLELLLEKYSVVDKTSLQTRIVELLRTAYYDSIGETNDIPEINNALIKVIPRGQFSLLNDCSKALTGDSDLKIIVMGDLFALDHVSKLCMAGIREHRFSMVNMRDDIQIDYILDITRLQDLSVYNTILLIHMMTSFSLANFNLYHSTVANGKLLIAAQEHFAGISLLGEKEQVLVSSCTKDKTTVNDLYDSIQVYLDTNQKVFFNTSMNDLINSHQYLQTVLAQDCRWVVGHVTETFLSPELFEQLLPHYFPQDQHAELRLAYNLSSNLLRTDNIRIIFYSLSIMDFLLCGEIDLFNQKIILDFKQRTHELDYLRKLFAEMKDDKLKLVKEGFIDDFKYITNPCFFLSESMQYLRLENKCYKNNLLIVKNEIVQSAFEHLFEVLWHERPNMVIADKESINDKMNNFLEASALIFQEHS